MSVLARTREMIGESKTRSGSTLKVPDGARILIVCDDHSETERLKTILQRAGIVSECAKSITAGCEAAKSGRFQVVVSTPHGPTIYFKHFKRLHSADFSPTRGSTRIRVSTQVFCDPCFASSRCRSVERRPAAHIEQAEVSGRSEPSISAWPSGSITRQTRIQASGRPMEDT